MIKAYPEFDNKITNTLLECENIVLDENTPLDDKMIFSSIAFVLLRIKEDPVGVKNKIWQELCNS